jgi:hypothetical protein
MGSGRSPALLCCVISHLLLALGPVFGFVLYGFVASGGIGAVVVFLLNTPGVFGIYGRSLAASHSNEIPLASAWMDG